MLHRRSASVQKGWSLRRRATPQAGALIAMCTLGVVSPRQCQSHARRPPPLSNLIPAWGGASGCVPGQALGQPCGSGFAALVMSKTRGLVRATRMVLARSTVSTVRSSHQSSKLPWPMAPWKTKQRLGAPARAQEGHELVYAHDAVSRVRWVAHPSPFHALDAALRGTAEKTQSPNMRLALRLAAFATVVVSAGTCSSIHPWHAACGGAANRARGRPQTTPWSNRCVAGGACGKAARSLRTQQLSAYAGCAGVGRRRG